MNLVRKCHLLFLTLSCLCIQDLHVRSLRSNQKLAKVGQLDLEPIWNESMVRHRFNLQDNDSIKEYIELYTKFPGDNIFCICYSITIAQSLYITQPKRRWLCVAAQMIGITDLVENFYIQKILKNWPNTDDLSNSVLIGSSATLLKWFFFLILPVSIISEVSMYLENRNKIKAD